MTYEELVNKFAKENQLEYDEAAHFIDSFFAVIKLNLAKGEEVKIFKFGSFSTHTITTKLARNKNTNEIEITPDEIYPHFEPSRSLRSGKVKISKKPSVKSKKKKFVQIPASEKSSISSANQNYILIAERYYKKTIVFFICFLIIFSISFYFGFRYFKNKLLRPYINRRIEHYLSEKGYTYSAIEEMVNSSFREILTKTDRQNQEMSEAIASQLKKLKIQQEASLKKLTKMEVYLKEKIKSMIKPQLKKRKKRAQVKMKLYTIKKNDTLWGLSKKYLKNPYNWVGLYKTNGKKIKNPDKIYPGQRIFIPVIREY